MKSTLAALIVTLLASIGTLMAQGPIPTDNPSHFSGMGHVQLLDARHDRHCTYSATVEVKSPREYAGSGYRTAFSYTLRDLTPLDGSCQVEAPEYVFTALCRAFSMSTGMIGIDVPMLGVITVTPRTQAVRRFFANNTLNEATWGFGASWLKYKVTRLSDGGIEVLSYLDN